ncbi:30S ribosomal protein S20 [Lujinxingia litoralis]|uniref:Small ribosomal subunit protein bS20 n=1 Tax=Lujinxingia litoralis TaxID=2211119 RepID=A0A328C6G0_9DELT|nr:30S ribosomal protein S20 [Lujinxingia litoralis]RAL21713.1 30S ribosomal protein S20 [Lujinxingia litoralis]
MANSKSAKKRAQQNVVRRDRNRNVRSALGTKARKFLKVVESGDVSAAEVSFRSVESALDRAASKGVIPRKRAARKASRLALHLEKMRAQG